MPLTVPLLSNFDDVDAGNLGPDWVNNVWQDGAAAVKRIGNAATFDSYGASGNSALTLLGTQDIEIGGPIVLPSASGSTLGIGIVVASTAGVAGQADGYLFAHSLGGVITPIRYDNSVETDLSTSAGTFQSGDKMIFRRRASDGLMSWIRDRAGSETVLATMTNTTYTGPFNVVLAGYDPGATSGFAELYAGNIGAAPVTGAAALSGTGSQTAAGTVTSTAQVLLPDADLATAGWSTAPLYSKVNDGSDATTITSTLS